MYEYKDVFVSLSESITKLNKLGEEGWELCSTIYLDCRLLHTLKRKINIC